MATRKLTDQLKIAIKDEFIHGILDEQGQRQFPTIDGLVKAHNVARATLFRHANKENWQQQKNKVQTEIEQKLSAERLTRMIEDGNRLDDTALVIAQGMLQKVGRRLQRGFADEQQNPETGGLATDEVRDLSQVALNAQKIGKLALGQAQEIQKVSADVSNPEAFREVMEQLDELAEIRSSRHKHTVQ